MKIADILKITPEDANKMSTQELYDAVWDLSRSVNKMRSGLIREGLDTLSLQRLEKKGGRLSVMELDSEGKSTGVVKTRNELLSELMRGLRFYRADDSSISKQKKIMKSIERRYHKKFDNIQQYADFWTAVRKIHEIAGTIAGTFESDTEVNVALEMDDYKNINYSDITTELKELYRETLDKREETYQRLTKSSSRMFSANK